MRNGKELFSRNERACFAQPFTIIFMLTVVSTPVCGAASNVKIQLCMIIDGSGTISSTEWNLTVQAVAEGVNETIPHDGSIELTIVQFGYSSGLYARTELAPRIIDEATYSTVAAQILAIPKMGGSTPTASGVYLG